MLGGNTSNPSELLGSEKMTNLIAKLEKEWDMVLFDSPPLIVVTDAALISKEIDAIVMVVKIGGTNKGAFSHTLNALENVKAPLCGIILNGVTDNSNYGSYYYYYQYYQYYEKEIHQVRVHKKYSFVLLIDSFIFLNIYINDH